MDHSVAAVRANAEIWHSDPYTHVVVLAYAHGGTFDLIVEAANIVIISKDSRGPVERGISGDGPHRAFEIGLSGGHRSLTGMLGNAIAGRDKTDGRERIVRYIG